MSTTKKIKIVLTKAGTAYDETKEYRLHDYIILDNSVMYICRRVDATTMVCVGHPLTDEEWWDKSIDLSTAVDECASELKTSVSHLNETMGPYSDRPSITLTPTATGYVIDSNGAKVAKSGWAMAEFTAEKGNVYLFKPGATDGNVSVFAEAISSVETRGIDYTYTYNSDGTIATATATYGGKTHNYTYTWADGTATIKEGSTIVSELPMTYTTTVGSYSPLVRLNANAELPEDGYCRYMSHFKGNSSIKVVVSYKVGAADLTMKVTRDGVLASISTQLGNLSQKEDETRNLLADYKLKQGWIRIQYPIDSYVEVDGQRIECPANKMMVFYPQKSLYFGNKEQIRYINIKHLNLTNFTSIRALFDNNNSFANGITHLDVSDWDTSNITRMDWCFRCCTDVKEIDVSGFDTSKVTNMYGMFIGCTAVTYLDISGFDTSNVTDMARMFDNCSSLTSLDVSGWNTSNVTDIYKLFNSCSSLTSLDVSGFDTSNVTNMYCMFSGCSSLTSLDVSSFDTKNVADMNYMFNDCSSLTSLDVSSFDTSKVTDMGYMFRYCSSLTNLLFGSKWGTQTSTAANALTLGLSTLGSSKSYKLTDATYTSMLTMYDRASAGLTTMTIKFSTKHNLPDGFAEKMSALGYTIQLV